MLHCGVIGYRTEANCMSTRRRIPEILSLLVMLGMLLAMISHIHAQTKDTRAIRNTILAIAQASAPAVPSTADLRVTLLGTATPTPCPDRFGPARWWKLDRKGSCSTADAPARRAFGNSRYPWERSSSSLPTYTMTIRWEFQICGLQDGSHHRTEVERSLLRCGDQRVPRK